MPNTSEKVTVASLLLTKIKLLIACYDVNFPVNLIEIIERWGIFD